MIKHKETCKWTYYCSNLYFPECQNSNSSENNNSSEKYDVDKFCSYCGKEIEEIE